MTGRTRICGQNVFRRYQFGNSILSGRFLIAFVIVRKNPFDPTSLFLGEPILSTNAVVVIDNELFVATKGAHFSETHCFLPAVTLLYLFIATACICETSLIDYCPDRFSLSRSSRPK